MLIVFERGSDMEFSHVVHTFGPIYNEQSNILILGSVPSVKSREMQFYYGHPQNRFWKVTAGIWQEDVPETIEEKKNFLLRSRIALWDVIESCDIMGSSDSSIKNVVPNDMDVILKQAPVQAIFANGDKAYQLFLKYCKKDGQPGVYKLPSTSPANAAWNVERLIETWKETIARGQLESGQYLKKVKPNVSAGKSGAGKLAVGKLAVGKEESVNAKK